MNEFLSLPFLSSHGRVRLLLGRASASGRSCKADWGLTKCSGGEDDQGVRAELGIAGCEGGGGSWGYLISPLGRPWLFTRRGKVLPSDSTSPRSMTSWGWFSTHEDVALCKLSSPLVLLIVRPNGLFSVSFGFWILEMDVFGVSVPCVEP